MQIIPVIDLKNGAVVHARAGARDQYRPIATPLSRTSDPVDVVSGLLALHAFDALYVADLDAITGGGDNGATIARIKARFPHLVLWIDNGIAEVAAATAFLQASPDVLVLGSESQSDTALARRLAGHDRVVLSLDFRAAAFQGPADLVADPSSWPRRIIVMTLARVGTGGGPDLDRLDAIRRAVGARAVFAAGGVRDAGDIRDLAQRGVAGALVATSLHDGRLTGSDLATFSPTTTTPAIA